MSFIKLASNIKNLKINEVLIVNGIMKNSQKIINNSITLTQIARECNISHSVVSRLIQKLGWENWSAFVQSCIIEETFSQKSNSGIIKILDLQKIYLETFLEKNKQIIEQIKNLIQKSQIVLFFGERVSGNLAQYLSFLFSRKDIMSTHFFFENEIYPFLKNETLLFIFITSGRTDYNQLIEKAYAKGAKVILIDSSESNFKNKKIFYYHLPIISYFKNPDYMYLIRIESIRHLGLKIYEAL